MFLSLSKIELPLIYVMHTHMLRELHGKDLAKKTIFHAYQGAPPFSSLSLFNSICANGLSCC